MNSHQKELEDLRDILFARMIDAPSGAVAGIAREYRQVLEDLENLNPSNDEDETLDELSQYRSNRQAASGN